MRDLTSTIVAAGLMLAVWGPAGLQRARQALLPPPVPAALPVVALLLQQDRLVTG